MILKLNKNRLFIIGFVLLSLALISCVTTQQNFKENKDEKKIQYKPDIKYNRPCWIDTKPEDCEDIKNIHGNWIFFRGKIITQKISDELTEKQKKELKFDLISQYSAALKSKIKSEIKYFELCINEETKNQCNDLYNEKIDMVTVGKLKSNEMDIVEHYWEKTGNPGEWVLFALGKINKKNYSKKLNKVFEKKNKPLAPQVPKVPKVPKVPQTDIEFVQPIYSISSPSEITDIFDINNKYIYDKKELDKCEDVIIDFKPLPDKVKFDDCISIIQNDLKQIYSQRKEGYYLNDRVLHTDSECLKRKQKCRSRSDSSFVKDEMDKKYARTISCWQNSIKNKDTEYMNKRKNSLIQFEKADHDVKKFQHLLSKWNYEIDLQRHYKEQIILIETIHQQKKQLISFMYLVFTIANDDFSDINIEVIDKYSVKMAKKEIYNQVTEFNVLKSILLERGNKRNEYIKADYNIRIAPEQFDALEIFPERFMAKLMKFKVGFSSSTTELLDEQDISELKNIKANSYIIAGTEKIELDDNLKPVNQVQLKIEAFNQWKKIAAIDEITVSEENKNIIQKLVNDVIDENIKARKTLNEYQIDFEIELRKIQNKIDKNNYRIKIINHDLSDLLDTMHVLPYSVRNLNEKKQILSDVENRYLPYLKNLATQKELITKKLMNVQHSVEQMLIESTLEQVNLITQASERIERVINDSQNDLCSGAFVGSYEIHNNKPVHEESMIENLQPILVGYQLPIIKIKPEGKHAKFSMPIMLKVRCESIQRSFNYDEAMNVIVDLSTNVSWKVSNNRYPMRRINNNEDWEYPRLNNSKDIESYLNDYKQFFTNYNKFYQKVSNTYIYQKYPQIKYIKRFSIESNNNSILIKDFLRQEEWKIIENITYNGLLMKIRKSSWDVNTVESLERFFYEVKANLDKNQLDLDIIKTLSDRYFWTSTKVTTRTLATITFDFKGGQLAEKPQLKEDVGVAIVTRKMRGL